MLSTPENWIDLHGDILYRYALSRVGKPEIAEDLVQEALLAALQNAKSFLGGSSERTWLISILKRKIIDHFRKTGREKPLSGSEEARLSYEDGGYFDETGHWKNIQEWGSLPSDILEDKEFWRVLSGCLDKLPLRMRQVFLLSEQDGLKGKEVCKVLGLSPSNLWVLLHRAKNGLRQCLETNWFDFLTVHKERKS